MADLEDLLLEAAGRTGAPGRNRLSRRQREASSSDDASDSEDYASRKPSGSQVPLKKRLDPTDDEDDMASGSDESDVGSDLYKGDADREKLAQLSELDRELILSERAQKRDDHQLTKRVRGKQSGKKNHVAKELAVTARVRSSARFTERTAAKDDALNELRAKRLKQQDPESHHRERNVGRDTSPARRNSIMAAQSSDSSQSENLSQSHSRDEVSGGEEDSVDSDEEMPKDEEPLTLEDIMEITIKRSKLAKWLMEPFFEELIVGCFVRVGIGKRDNRACYRLCIVNNVDATEPDKQYRLESKSTHKYLSVTWGRSEARWQMAVISDSPTLEVEFNEWVQAMNRDGVQMPSRKKILEKQEAIQKAVTFVYSSATVKQMLQEKKSSSSRPLNIAAEKDRLRREMDVAENKADWDEKDRITGRLKELEAISSLSKGKDSKAARLEAMNKKNRAENFKNASELKPVNTSLKAGEAGYDPFSRRWTRSKNYYVPNSGEGDEAANSAKGDLAAEALGASEDKGAGVVVVTGVVTTTAALEAAAEAGKLIDTKAPVDNGTESNTLHNFKLEISLDDLKKFGGHQGAHLGFMARKQRTEATIGCKVLENDGKRHSQTLTISDYKRRRGLL